MTRGEISAAVLSQIGNNPYVTGADVEGFINRAMREMGKYVRPFDDYFSFQTQIGFREYTLPDNLIKLKDPVAYQGNELTEISLVEAQNLYSNWWAVIAPPSILQGVPDRYYTRRVMTTNTTIPGTAATRFLTSSTAGPYVIGFYLTPNDAQTVDCFGTFVPGDLTQDTQSPPFQPHWHTLILDYCLWWSYLKLKQPEMGIYHKKTFEEGLLLFDHEMHDKPEYVQSGVPELQI